MGIDQAEDETAALAGAVRIDDFRLRGSRTWRRMGEYSTETRSFTWTVHAFDHHKSALSEGGASPLWCRLYLEIRIGHGLARIPQVL